MPRKSSKKKSAKDEVTVVEKEGEEILPPKKVEVAEVKKVEEEEDEVAWVRKQLSAASKQKENVDDIRDAINDPDSEFKFMPPDTNRSTASLAMVSDEKAAAAAPPKRGRKQKAAADTVESVAVAAPPVVVADKPAAATVAAKPSAQPSGKPAWLLAQEKAQASRTETVTAKPAVKAAWTDESKDTGSKKVVAEATTLRIKTEAKPVAKPVAVVKPAPVQAVVVDAIEITPARVDMAVGKEYTSRVLPNQQVVTRIFSGIYNAEPCDSDVNGMF